MSDDVKTCPVCKQKFTREQVGIQPSQWSARKYCSVVCLKASNHYRTVGRRQTEVVSKPKRCPVCKRVFTRKELGLTVNQWFLRVFCGRKCMLKDRRPKRG